MGKFGVPEELIGERSLSNWEACDLRVDPRLALFALHLNEQVDLLRRGLFDSISTCFLRSHR
jgi:hypothetical protein